MISNNGRYLFSMQPHSEVIDYGSPNPAAVPESFINPRSSICTEYVPVLYRWWALDATGKELIVEAAHYEEAAQLLNNLGATTRPMGIGLA